MITNEQLLALLKAQIQTGDVGLSSPQDTQEFIDMTVDQTAILREIRVETGIKTSLNLDALEMGEPAMVAATEGQAPDAADVVKPDHVRKILTPVETLSAYDVTFDTLRKNIVGEEINAYLNRIFSKRYGKDVVLTAFNGDTALAASSRTNKALRVLDGFIKQMEGDAAVHDYELTGVDYLGTVFPGMLNLMPKDYKDDRDMLAFFVSASIHDAYEDQIGARVTALGDQVLFGGRKPLLFKSIRVLPVFGMPDNRIILTVAKNLAIGFGHQMEVGRDVYNRTRTVEVTITSSFDAKYVLGDAVVLAAPA